MKYKIMKIAFWSMILIAFATEVYAVTEQIGQIPQLAQLPQSMGTPTSMIVEIGLTSILAIMGWMGKKLYDNVEDNQKKHENFMVKLADKINNTIERVAVVEEHVKNCSGCNKNK